MFQITSQADLSLEKVFEELKGFEIDSLKSVVNSNKQMEFLKVLSDAEEFIEWLQRETKSIMHIYIQLYP